MIQSLLKGEPRCPKCGVVLNAYEGEKPSGGNLTICPSCGTHLMYVGEDPDISFEAVNTFFVHQYVGNDPELKRQLTQVRSWVYFNRFLKQKV